MNELDKLNFLILLRIKMASLELNKKNEEVEITPKEVKATGVDADDIQQ